MVWTEEISVGWTMETRIGCIKGEWVNYKKRGRVGYIKEAGVNSNGELQL